MSDSIANKPLGGEPPKPGAKDPQPREGQATVAAGSHDITIELVR